MEGIFMVTPIGESQIVRQLRGVACKLTSDHELQKDLMQEMFVHMIRVQTETPLQTPSWYIKSCEFHVRNHMKLGRSIDSPKRARNGVPLFQSSDEHGFDPNDGTNPADPFDLQGEMITNDILGQLVPKLTEMSTPACAAGTGFHDGGNSATEEIARTAAAAPP